jgi:hypothetical protein
VELAVEIKICPTCKGRGEVAAGISLGVKEHMDGSAEPKGYIVNPAAWSHAIQDVWLLDKNPHGKLWGIAICRHCHGTGMER